jgi:phage shock protein A
VKEAIMTLRLSDRIATLLRADAHGIIESLEERSLLLKQYVREAELELNRKRACLETVREEEKRLREAAERCENEMASIDEDISLALGGGKEDLARFSIRRILPLRARLDALRTQIEQRQTQCRALAERLAEQEKQFETLRGRVRADLSLADEAGSAPLTPLAGVVADEEVELELMRRRKQLGGQP